MRRLAWGVLLLCACSAAPGAAPVDPSSTPASDPASDPARPDDVSIHGSGHGSGHGPDGATDDAGNDAHDWCAAAEARLEELGCRDPRGDPMWVNRRGERFRDTCRVAQDQGGIFLDPQCIAHAQRCEEANACPPG